MVNLLMLFILSFVYRHRMLGYMSRSYFDNDYFAAGNDPSLHFLPEQYPQRKPSYDDILPCFFSGDEANPPSHATCDSPKPTPQDAQISSPPEKKTKKKRENPKTLGEGIKRGHWNTEENKRYHWFLELYSNHFLNKHMRRMDKIFKTMEKFVISREAEQCRSHHQKMQKKHGSFLKILKELRKTHYGSGDVDSVFLDMKSSGVECKEQLLSWGELQAEVVERTEEPSCSSESGKEQQAVVLGAEESFVDPFEQFQCEGDQFLQALIN